MMRKGDTVGLAALVVSLVCIPLSIAIGAGYTIYTYPSEIANVRAPETLGVRTLTPTPVPTPNASPTLSTPSSATPAITQTMAVVKRPSVSGSPGFVSRVGEALDKMQVISPADYLLVGTHVTRVVESGRNYSQQGSGEIEVGTASSALGWAPLGSVIIHEATHIRNYTTKDFPVYGCEGEAKSLWAQAAYLDKATGPRSGDWARALMGTWC